MKKVQTSQVLMTPTPGATIRLDELNTMLAEMATGEEAVKRMAEMDSQRGLQTKKRVDVTKTTAGDVGEPKKLPSAPAIKPLQAGLNEALTDEAIATQQVAQATRMRAEAQSMLNEATRLEGEAAKIAPSVVKTTKKAVADTVVTEKRKPGRPKAIANDTTKQKAQKAKI
jgi:hypothetical protein